MNAADYGRFCCEYCGREGGYPSEIETRHGKLVCRDIAACDARDAAQAAAGEARDD